jgi:hypothetical protein
MTPSPPAPTDPKRLALVGSDFTYLGILIMKIEWDATEALRRVERELSRFQFSKAKGQTPDPAIVDRWEMWYYAAFLRQLLPIPEGGPKALRDAAEAVKIRFDMGLIPPPETASGKAFDGPAYSKAASKKTNDNGKPAQKKRGRPSKKEADKDIADEFYQGKLAGEWDTIAEFARYKRRDRSTISKAITRGQNP